MSPITVDRLGECPYSDAMGTACGEVCDYDADCPGSTAKCCYNPNCGGNGDSRCYDQGISSGMWTVMNVATRENT